MLSLVLVALVGVFWLLLGDRMFGIGALQSMAFQLPELGILSLAMMVTLLSGGLNLSIIATANLCALTMALGADQALCRRRKASCGSRGR